MGMRDLGTFVHEDVPYIAFEYPAVLLNVGNVRFGSLADISQRKAHDLDFKAPSFVRRYALGVVGLASVRGASGSSRSSASRY